MKRLFCLLAGLGLLSLLLPLCGCEVGSADSVVRNVGIDFSGFYVGAENGALVSKNSGRAVETLNLRQNGDQLEATDNNSSVYRGRLGNVVDTTASFTLEGNTTAGRPVVMSGTLRGEGSQATMSGTWIEPDFYATLSGTGTINPAPTNTTGSLMITPASATLSTNSQQQVFSVSNGSSPYSWSLSSTSLGSLSSSTGSSVTYTRTSSGSNTLTVRDSAGRTGTAVISQP